MSEFTSNGADKRDNWQSPRAKRELAKLAIREVFEDNMTDRDNGYITHEVAISRSQEFAEMMNEEYFLLDKA